MKYKKRPVVIEAVRWTGKNLAELRKMDGFEEVHLCFNGKLSILTLEGIVDASVGDYIIRGVNGEFYPCKPDIFAKTYEPVVNVGGKPVGVYIHGVEMPKEKAASLIICSSGKVYYDHLEIAGHAVPVPPHGRLVDLDNLRKELETICDRYDAGIISEVVCMNMMLQAVISATTIIPADPAEEG